MSKLKEVFELIHSLEKNEKKHLSIMVEALGGKATLRYAHAIQIINKQKIYDKERLKSNLSKDVSGMNLTEALNNLYSFIKHAMLSYRSPKDAIYESELFHIQFLIKKKLYESAHKKLQAILPNLEDKSSYAMLMFAEELQEKITIFYKPVNADTAFRTNFFKQRKEHARRLNLAIDLLEIKFHFFQLARNVGDPRTEEQLKQYVLLWENESLHLPNATIPNRSFHSFIWLKAVLMSMVNMPNAQEQIKEFIEELKTRIGGRVALKGEYDLQDLRISLLSSSNIILEDDLIDIENRLRFIAKGMPKTGVALLIENKIAVLKTLYYTKLNKYNEGVAYYENEVATGHIETWINTPLSYVTIILTAINYFLAGKTNESLDLLLEIQDKEKSMAPTFYVIYRMLLLLCHYQLKNTLYLESAIRSLQRNLSKRAKLYAFQKALLRFLRNSNDLNKIDNNFEKLYDTMQKLSVGKFDNAYFKTGSFMKLLEAIR
ncbi:MAG: hypothetical protein H6578_03265 [Chitinophagales bacterium]|nr:hypothetical protein [Chitinophagales bacterium]